MAAAKFLDAIARLTGNDGEDSDAICAYTQVKLSEAAKFWDLTLLLKPGFRYLITNALHLGKTLKILCALSFSTFMGILSLVFFGNFFRKTSFSKLVLKR